MSCSTNFLAFACKEFPSLFFGGLCQVFSFILDKLTLLPESCCGELSDGQDIRVILAQMTRVIRSKRYIDNWAILQSHSACLLAKVACQMAPLRIHIPWAQSKPSWEEITTAIATWTKTFQQFPTIYGPVPRPPMPLTLVLVLLPLLLLLRLANASSKTTTTKPKPPHTTGGGGNYYYQ